MKYVTPLLLTVGLSTVGCQFHARGPEDYRAAVRKVLETRSNQVQACYNEALKTEQGAKGSLVVMFKVEPDTGVISTPEVTPESTAPPALGQCVVQSLQGLTLNPPDAREGHGTFVWDFSQAT
jgi:hypothetical protein